MESRRQQGNGLPLLIMLKTLSNSVRIFAAVKNASFQSIILALVFVMPMVFASVAHLGDDCEMHAFFENCTEEGQADEKESDVKEERDLIEAFVFQEFALLNQRDSQTNYFSKSKELVSISKDVLTPPPEFI